MKNNKQTNARSSFGYIAGIGNTNLNINRLDTKNHECRLLGDPSDIVARYIEAGVFVDFRRKFRRYIMISSKHPYTRYYAPSLHCLKQEEQRHLLWYYSVIHPLSLFCLIYEIFMCCIYLLATTLQPIAIMGFAKERQMAYIAFYPSSILTFIHIILNFCIGYYDVKKNRVYLRRKSIAYQYLKTYFIFDVLSILPQFLRGELVNTFGKKFVKRHQISFNVIKTTLILSTYVRYCWCLKILYKIRLYFGINTYTYQTVLLVLNTYTITGVLSYVVYTILMSMIRDVGPYQTILKYVEYTLKVLMLVSYGHPVFQYMDELVIAITLILIGFIFHLFMLVKASEVWLRFFSVENKQTTVYNSAKAYMRYRALPVELRHRIQLYLNFKYQGYFYKENVIRNITSPDLRKEVLLSVTKESTQKVELFNKCTNRILNKLRAMLVYKIYLPGDFIIRSGSPGRCMYLILAGTVVVTNPEGKELCYLRDGQHFGEIALIIHIARVANVMAVTPCELYQLDRNDFWEVMKDYPELIEEIKHEATDRIVGSGSNSKLDYFQAIQKSNLDILKSSLHIDTIHNTK